MDKEHLHAEIERLNFRAWHVRAILHGMIDAGKVTALECQLEDCVMADRSFEPRIAGRGYTAAGRTLCIDHIVPRLQGGSDRPENLQLVHSACNMHRARGWKMSDEGRAKLSLAAKARGSWRPAVEGRQPGWNRKTRADDQRGGNKPRALDDLQVAEARKRYAAGEIYEQIAGDYGVSKTTMMAVVRGLGAYADN